MNQETIDSPEIIHALRVATYWARGQGLELNRLRSGFARLEDALFIPLDPESRQQFADGAGGELTRLHSLRSSSALAYNTFAPWKTDPTRVASVLGGLGPYDALGFEQQYPTGVSSRHPHLDVVLAGGAPPVAVESKFLEIYDEPKPAEFSRRYLAADELWTGLPNLRALAEELAENPWAFQRLGAAQLVKHTLGLARKYGHDGFSLVYLWYDFYGETAQTHRAELERFTQVAAQDITFGAMTHQDLFGRLTKLEEPIPGYLKYLAGRYGLG
jgi:hypothetical protein